MKTNSIQALSAPVGNFSLDVRCKYVLAKVTISINPGGTNDLFAAEWDAEWLGLCDAEACRQSGMDTEIPAFFADVPELARAWTRGWKAGLEMADIEHCSLCNNVHGRPCLIHDRVDE